MRINGELKNDWSYLIKKLEKLRFDTTFSEFRSMKILLELVAQTRPDCLL